MYEKVLKEDPVNLNAHIYKSACLEKLYYSSGSWHNEETLKAAGDYLQKALDIAKGRGDRSKIGFVHFRFCIHYYNIKNYELAKRYLEKCESMGYSDNTLPLWKFNIESEYEKLAIKNAKHGQASLAEESSQFTDKEGNPGTEYLPADSTDSIAFKTDWYQSASTVTISLFIRNLPKSKADVSVNIVDSKLSVSYPVLSSGSEFQYSITLNQSVDPNSFTVNVFSKKIEITLNKLVKAQWKSLEKSREENVSENHSFLEIPSTPSLSYPSSSKKAIDWSKLDIDDADEEESKTESADAFFQQIYKGADDDTRRAMMKSFIESNGTSLNTNWEEVSKGKVQPALPDGVEIKKL